MISDYLSSLRIVRPFSPRDPLKRKTNKNGSEGAWGKACGLCEWKEYNQMCYAIIDFWKKKV